MMTLTFDLSSRHSRRVWHKEVAPSRISIRRERDGGRPEDILSLCALGLKCRLFRSLVTLIIETRCFPFYFLKTAAVVSARKRGGYRHIRCQTPSPPLGRRRSFAPLSASSTPPSSSAVARAPTELRAIAGVHHSLKHIRRCRRHTVCRVRCTRQHEKKNDTDLSSSRICTS